MKKYYTILTEKLQKNEHYHLEKQINMNTSWVKKSNQRQIIEQATPF